MSTHDDWLKYVVAYKEELQNKFGINLELPPPSLRELQLEYLEIVPGKKISAKLAFQKRFTNPVALFQGGFLTAAIDEVFGPLSYITATRPCLTLSLNTTFLKAFSEKMQHCFIEAVVIQKTSNLIFMRAEVTSPLGDLLAHAESHATIMRDDQLQRTKS